MNVDLEWDERQRLTELLAEYRRDVASGSISGFHHPVEEELADVDALLAKLGDS